MNSKYTTLRDGDGFEIKNKDFIYFACCDCGLVHKFVFAIEENGSIGFALERDTRRTGQRRRYHNHPCKEEK